MEIIETNLEGVVIIQPKVFKDNRGYFFESWNQQEFNEKVRPISFVQDNESCSSYGVLRGLHYQKGEHAQSKLVRVIKGSVLDVAVDIRVGSPTFGQYAYCMLDGDNHNMFFIPRGFAHGFVTLTDNTVVQYKCDNFYCKESEGAIAWNDPIINIDWILKEKDIVLSNKDMLNKCMAELQREDLFDYNIKYYDN